MTDRVTVVTACPVCGAGDRTELAWRDQQLLRCRCCGAVHASRYADPSQVYVCGYHSGATQYHRDVTREPFATYLRRVNEERMTLLERYARPPGRLLDVGCGAGQLLQAAQAHGWAATGLEPVEDTAATARVAGLDVVTGTLEEQTLEPAAYDAVVASHVLEHLPAVDPFLRSLSRLTRPGGVVFLEVPNWSSAHRRLSGDSWPLLAPGEHVTHFTPAVLSAAVLRAGLQPISLSTRSWIGPPQNLAQALRDLGLIRARRLFTPLSRRDPARPVVRYPTAAGWALLRGVAAGFDLARIGMVIVLVARVAQR
jgi:2-polyprenyl-3-methyl-5-hydroxy-6-metoxy-1,4-benzoquinol methylase